MKNRIGLVVLIIFGGTGCFFWGYFNQEVGKFFLNKDALIGGLTVFGISYYVYAQYLEKRNLRDKYYHEHVREEVERLREEKYKRVTYHEKLDEVKTLLIEEMHKIKKEVKK